MSKIEVNQVDPQSGTTLTLGTSGDTISIPAGVTLANSGTATGFASIAWQSTIVTGSTLTAVAGNGYWIDTTSNACTITLPGSASVGDQISIRQIMQKKLGNKCNYNKSKFFKLSR
jgi:N6-adenosine-specific RNA methylase IME4